MWHVIHDMWHMPCDTWHMTCGGRQTFSQNFSSLALTVSEWRFVEDILRMDDSLTYSISDKAVYRTAQATPGLLIKHGRSLWHYKWRWPSFRCPSYLDTNIYACWQLFPFWIIILTCMLYTFFSFISINWDHHHVFVINVKEIVTQHYTCNIF